METTVPAVKSLLVRARISLADASQGRHLTCDEVHLELAEATEGLRKMSGPARSHMKDCERCREYRSELRRNDKALAALVPDRPARRARDTRCPRSSGSAAPRPAPASSAGAGAGGAGAGAGGAAAARAAARRRRRRARAGRRAAAAGLGGAALGAKAAAGMASVALLTAGAVEVQQHRDLGPRRRSGQRSSGT